MQKSANKFMKIKKFNEMMKIKIIDSDIDVLTNFY